MINITATATTAAATAVTRKKTPPGISLALPKPGVPEILDVREQLYLMYDGRGAPGSDGFQDALHALYSVAYGAKFVLKKRGIATGKMGPLEALWSVKDWAKAMSESPENITWTALMAPPPEVDLQTVEEVISDAVRRKGIAAAAHVRLQYWAEGPCVQILHIGPYSAEGPSVAKMHEYAAAQGYRLHGRHHEIYLSDPRRVAPEKLRTLLRQPVMR